MPNQKTYGRRPKASARAVEQCFLATSSPLKPSTSIKTITPQHSKALLRDDGLILGPRGEIPAQQAHSFDVAADEVVPTTIFEQRKDLASEQTQEDVKLAIEKLQSFNIHEENVNTARTQVEEKDKIQVLSARDPNHVPGRRRPRRSYENKFSNDEIKIENPVRLKRNILPPTNFTATEYTTFKQDTAAAPRSPTTQFSSLSSPPRARRRQLPSSAALQNISTIQQPLPPHTLSHLRPLLSLTSSPTNQAHPVPFSSWTSTLTPYFQISKIAEASYGEVYRLALRSQHPKFEKGDESVLKIVALKSAPPSSQPLAECAGNAETVSCAQRPNGKVYRESKKEAAMSSVDDVASEVRLLQLMSPVPGFTRFRDVTVLYGRPGAAFIAAWREYNTCVKKSLFPDPGRKGSYGDSQLWAVVEMQDAGGDVEGVIERATLRKTKSQETGEEEEEKGGRPGLESEDKEMDLDRLDAVWDVFWGVACAVAKGEEWAGFEHRDLHLGNICVRQASHKLQQTTATGGKQKRKHKLGLTNLATTIIDYTLSRATIPNSAPTTLCATPLPFKNNDMLDHESNSNPIPANGENDEDNTAFFDLSKDPAIFAGDGEVEYQYDIYRYMRSAVLHGDPLHATPPPPSLTRKKGARAGQNQRRKLEQDKAKEREAWRSQQPVTNLVWLHFVLHELCKQPAVAAAIDASVHNAAPCSWQASGVLTTFADDGTEDAQDRGGRGTGGGEMEELARKLATLQHLLELRNLGAHGKGKAKLKSAADLVVWAVGSGWLDEEDVVGVGLERE